MPRRSPPKSARSSRIIRFRSIRHRVFSRHIFLNPHLAQLRPYTFERLRALFATVVPNPRKAPISLSIGEPRHPTPQLLLDALAAGAKGLANYPTTAGVPELRKSIAEWLERRHKLPPLDPATQ